MAYVVAAAGAIGETLSGIAANNANARMAEAEGRAARVAAAIDEAQYRYKARREIARGEAIAAASGLDPTSGTPMDVLLESMTQAELNARRIRYGGRVQDQMAKAQASAYRSRNFWTVVGGATKGASIYSSWLNKRTT